MATNNVCFLDTFQALPAAAPANHAHILDLIRVGQSKALIQDAIVTLLYKVSPEILTNLLDAGAQNFKLFQSCKGQQETRGFVIIKKGSEVLVGEVSIFEKHNIIEFDNLARLTIKEDQSWQLTYASYRDYFKNDWDQVWTGQTVSASPTLDSLNMRAKDDNDPTKQELAGFIAEGILQNPPWNPEFFESTFTWI